MKEASFILIDTGSQSNKIMMSDVDKMTNGCQLSEVYNISSPILKRLYHLHFSYKLSTKVNLPLKSIWNKYCVLDEMLLDDNKEYFVIFVNNSVHKIDARHINQLAERNNVHLILLLLDAYHELCEKLKQQMDAIHFEQIYSFQKSDCEKYGFIYTNTIYSRAENVSQNKNYTSDLYFLGADKNRIEQIYSIYQQVTACGLVCDFTVVCDKKKVGLYKEKYPGMKIIAKRVDYSEILEGVSGTRCLLELCQKGQDGLTMRFYEAVFYNKKLTTNNQTALVHPMYNSRYMQVIDDVSNLDVDFLKNREEVDYQYHDEMSPVHFTEKIIEVKNNDRN